MKRINYWNSFYGLTSVSRITPSIAVRTFALSHFAHVPQAPADKILGLNELFNADPNPGKINLGVGAYRDDNGKPWVLPCVRAAEAKIAGMNHEYGPIAGSPKFTQLATEFIYGPNCTALKEGRIAAVQALSGTGALCLITRFLAKYHPVKDLYVPDPTWGNHFNIFRSAGFNTNTYRYLDRKTFTFNVNNTLEDMDKAIDGSVFMFHACAQNPTGFDPKQSEWKEISKMALKHNHQLIFDCAYQGFASGDADKDAWAIRYFVEQGHQICLAQSFAKNFGLYGERIGCSSIIAADKAEKERIMSQLKVIVRSLWSNPPIYGARLVETILGDKTLTKQWYSECKTMADRIISMRTLLRDHLEKATGRKWNCITDQIGMFSYTGLNKKQVYNMVHKEHIYMTEDGRISMAGVNTKNVEKIAQVIKNVLKEN